MKKVQRNVIPADQILNKSISNALIADKITMYVIIGVMFLTAAVNLTLFLATLLHYLFPEDKGEKDEKK